MAVESNTIEKTDVANNEGVSSFLRKFLGVKK